MRDALSLSAETRRKSIHFFTALIPVSYFFFLSKEQIVVICIILSMGFAAADLMRMYNRTAGTVFMKIFSDLLRDPERSGRFTGATLLFVGLTVSALVFSKQIAVTSMLFLTLADPVAALIGKRWGRRRIFQKTILGSSGFFSTAVVVTILVWGFSWQGILVAALAACIELLPVPVNDNLTIPVFSGVLMHYIY